MRRVILFAVLCSLAFSCQAQEYTKTEGGKNYRCYDDPSPNIGEWCWEVTASTLKPTATTMRPATTIRPEDRPLAPGPGNGQCDPEIGEDCRTNAECSCLGGQTCDPSNAKANPRGCVSPTDAVKCPENAVAYGVDCVCREGYEWNGAKTGCVRRAGSESCARILDCPGRGENYCDGVRAVRRWECGEKFGCRKHTVRDCSADEVCIGDQCMMRKNASDGGCSGDEDCRNGGRRLCDGESVVYYHCTSAGCVRQEAVDCSVTPGSHCYDGACSSGSSGCRVEGACTPGLGDSCSGCQLCSCGDWGCRVGDPNADSMGCVNPCIGLDNTAPDKVSGECVCKSGFKPSRSGGRCILETVREGFVGSWEGFPMTVRKDRATGRLYMSFANGDRTYLDKDGEPRSYSSDSLESLKGAGGVPAGWEGYMTSTAVLREMWVQAGGASQRMLELGNAMAARVGGQLKRTESVGTTVVETPTQKYTFKAGEDGSLKLPNAKGEFKRLAGSSAAGRLGEAASGTDGLEAERLVVADQALDAQDKLKGGRSLDVSLTVGEAGPEALAEAIRLTPDWASGWPMTVPRNVKRVAASVEDESIYGIYAADKLSPDPNLDPETMQLPKGFEDFRGEYIPFGGRSVAARNFLNKYASGSGSSAMLKFYNEHGNEVSVSNAGAGRLAWKYEENKFGKGARFVLWSVRDDKPYGDLALYVEDKGWIFPDVRAVLGSKRHPGVKYNGGREYGL